MTDYNTVGGGLVVAPELSHRDLSKCTMGIRSVERARIRAILIVGGLGFAVLLWQTYQKSLTYSDRLQKLDETKFQIDINRAPSHELQLLPGVGEKMSENITQYRQTRGSIHSAEQLQELRGIGPKKADQMRPFIEFGAVK